VIADAWDPGAYARSARFVSDLGANVVSLLDAKPDERILDLGCGDGGLTVTIPAAHVTGVDRSPSFVAAARARGVDASLADGEALPFERCFDAVISNAALHWMLDADAVLRGVRRALVPGGRFVAEMGGFGNVAAIRAALGAVLARYGVDATDVAPWYFPTAEAYRAQLEAAGFTVDAIALHARPTRLPGDLGDWLEVFAPAFLDALAPADRVAARAAVVDVLRPILFDGTVWIADYVRLRFLARLTASDV
jgi:SAM-dependent methyltransferase